jgi:hypothetical protein
MLFDSGFPALPNYLLFPREETQQKKSLLLYYDNKFDVLCQRLGKFALQNKNPVVITFIIDDSTSIYSSALDSSSGRIWSARTRVSLDFPWNLKLPIK